uniref:Uncharacterized protein n=1 Tax=Caenorhabditis japonica TaxID=281687 RepID=A0A8R1EKL6_CAEJA
MHSGAAHDVNLEDLPFGYTKTVGNEEETGPYHRVSWISPPRHQCLCIHFGRQVLQGSATPLHVPHLVRTNDAEMSGTTTATNFGII